MEDMTRNVMPEIKTKRIFGYYSRHAVCLPNLFPDDLKEQSWSYSLIFILINLVAFSFMFLGYVAVYK